jgi:hypothetical protein
MSGRIVFEFVDPSGPQGARWAHIEEFLHAEGAEPLDKPSGEGASVIRAVVPEGSDPKQLISRLQRLDGVGRADVDALREIT